MARITIHIEAEGTGDLHAELEQLLRGNGYARAPANDDRSGPRTPAFVTEPVNTGPRVEPVQGWIGGNTAPAQYADDARVATVEAVQASDDLKPVRGKNADDLAAKLIADYLAGDGPVPDDQMARLPKKHQDQVSAAVVARLRELAGDTATEQPETTLGPTYKLVGAKGATIAIFRESDQFVSQIEDIAAKLSRRSDILELAAANADVVKTLSAEDQKRLEDAFGEALKAARDDEPAAEGPAESTAAEPVKAPTIDDVRAAVTEVANKLGMEAGRKVVVETGKAAKISEIDQANYQAVLDECKRLKGAA